MFLLSNLRVGSQAGCRTHSILVKTGGVEPADATVKGWCLNRLTTGPIKRVYFNMACGVCQAYWRGFRVGIILIRGFSAWRKRAKTVFICIDKSVAVVV